MCGIIVHHARTPPPRAVRQLVRLRGLQPLQQVRCGSLVFHHALLPLHGLAPQPFKGKGCGVFVGEVYNWQDVRDAYGIRGRNDAHAFFTLFESLTNTQLEDPFFLGRVLHGLDGQFVFVYTRDTLLLAFRSWPGTLMLARDPRSGMLASLQPSGWLEVHPRTVLYGSITAERIVWREEYLPWAARIPTGSFQEAFERVVARMFHHTPRAAIALGGRDSMLIAHAAVKHGFTPLLIHATRAARRDPDEEAQERLAQALGLELVHVRVPDEEIRTAARILARLVEPHTIKVSSALPLFFAAREARRRGFHVLFTGSGADELFASYARSRRLAGHAWLSESLANLLTFWERNGWREDAAVSFWQVEARQPYLERDVIARVWHDAVRDSDAFREKRVLDEILSAYALPVLKKRAAQYSSGMLKAVQRFAREEKEARPSAWLRQHTRKRRRAVVLISGGKDSFMAHLLAVQHNYEVPVWLFLRAREGSWLFHTPFASLVEGLARSVGIPLVTRMIPEADPLVEEAVLREALREVKRAFQADVLVVGALQSVYQRDRMLRAAESVGMSLYAPLWHVRTNEYLRLLFERGVKALIIRTAADGLTASHVGRVLSEDLVREFEEKGIHLAGEGGEYETFVIDSPLHAKRLEILSSRVVEDDGMFTLLPTSYRWVDKEWR